MTTFFVLSISLSLLFVILLTMFIRQPTLRKGLFVLVPVVMAGSLFLWQAENELKAQPIYGVPAHVKFIVLNYTVQGEWIYMWLVNLDDALKSSKGGNKKIVAPATYAIPYDKNKEKELAKAQEETNKGIIIIGEEKENSDSNDHGKGRDTLNFQTEHLDLGLIPGTNKH